ncbi:MAG: methionine aminotransferase [Chitinophagaceae bacterium]
MQFRSKLPYVTSHIFSHITALAQQYNALNLSQGFPNFEPAKALQDLLAACIQDKSLPSIHQYAPMPGLPLLREQIAAKLSATHGIVVNADTEVTVGIGATEMIFAAIAAFVWPGDEVIIIEPCFDIYRPAIDVVGGKAVVYKTSYPDFKIDWNAFAGLINNRTRMICICTPNNPTGTLFSKEDMEQLAALVTGTDILIISDEVYEHVIFDGAVHISPLQYPALRERTFAAYSFGKTYHITGWKVGYCIAPPGLTTEMRKVHQNAVYAASHPLQKAIALYMQQSTDYFELPAFYQRKRDLFLQATSSSRFRPLPCKGGYFQLFDYAAISNEDDVSFCERLIKEHGVAAIPVSRLYTDNHDDHIIRFCFAKTDELLLAAGERLCRI